MKNYGLFAFLGMALITISLQARHVMSESAYRDDKGRHFREHANGDLMAHIDRHGVPATFPVPGSRSTYHHKSTV